MAFHQQTTLLCFLALLLLATTNVQACSCALPPGPDTLNLNVLRHDVVARVWINKEIIEPQPDTDSDILIAHYPGEPNYYNARIGQMFKGDEGEGKIIVKTGVCGGSLQEKTNYLLFGSISYQKVYDYVGKVPVLTAASCTLQPLWKQVSKSDKKILRAFDAQDPQCYPGDCEGNLMTAHLCPDKKTAITSSGSCDYMKTSNSCAWTEIQPNMKEECPGSCTLNSDCDKANEYCDVNGFCYAK